MTACKHDFSYLREETVRGVDNLIFYCRQCLAVKLIELGVKFDCSHAWSRLDSWMGKDGRNYHRWHCNWCFQSFVLYDPSEEDMERAAKGTMNGKRIKPQKHTKTDNKR